MRDAMAAFITTISFSSSAIFLYLTFNREIDGLMTARFIILTPFVAGVLFGIGICVMFTLVKKRNAKVRAKKAEEELLIKEYRTHIIEAERAKEAMQKSGKKRKKR